MAASASKGTREPGSWAARPTPSASSSTAPSIWAEVHDELRSRQSLSSVINDPLRGKGIFRRDVDGIGDLFDKLKESVEDINEQRDNEAQEAVDAERLARTEELFGSVPQVADFQPYLEAFTALWDVYYRNNQAKIIRARRGQEASRNDGLDDDAACDAHHAVPPEYFQTDFKLEHHSILKQPLQSVLEHQDEFNADLTGHLDTIEVSLFEHIRRAQRDQLFETLARMGEPLQEDLKATLSVITALRQQMHSVQRKQLRCGLAVGQLARRKKRMAEVLQRLDCLSHVREALPSIQMLMQGGDYVTALDLLESAQAASDMHLRGLSCVRHGNATLASFGSTFDRVVEADFVQHSVDAVLGGPDGSACPVLPAEGLAAPAAEELYSADRVQRLCGCMTRRNLLKLALSSTLRDLLRTQMTKVIKNSVKDLLVAASVQAGGQAGGAAAAAPAGAGVNGGASSGPPEANGEADPASRAAAEEPGSQPANDAAGGPGTEALVSTSAGMTKALKGLSFEAFFGFWRHLLQVCIAVAGRLRSYAALISAASQEQPDEAPTLASGAGVDDEVTVELSRLFEVTISTMLQKVGLLAQARDDEHRGVRIEDWRPFLTFTHEALDRIRALQDAIVQKIAVKEVQGADVRSSVKTVLYAQTKGIVEEFHKTRMDQVQATVEQERWEKTDVPAPYRHMLDRLTGQALESLDGGVHNDQAGTEKNIRFDGCTFHVVPGVLTLVQVLSDYMQLCRDVDFLVGEIVQRMGQLLRLFNSQAQRQLLGGQLTKQSGANKKTITAVNLALCSQCCDLVAQVLPKVQAQFLSVLSSQENGAAAPDPARAGGAGGSRPSLSAAAIAELSKVAAEFGDHRTSLYGKLSIMLRERYDVHAKKWLSAPHPEAPTGPAPWDEGAGPDADVELKPHESVENLAKDIYKMYQFILRILPSDTVRRIFSKAFAEIASKFEQHIGQELAAPSPPYEAKPGRTLGDRLAMDVAYMREQLGKLSAVATPMNSLVCDLVHHLQTKLPADEPLKRLQPVVLEALQRTGRIPQSQ